MPMGILTRAIAEFEPMTPHVRVRAYNAGAKALAALVADISTDPALAPQLVPADDVHGNDYNPNHVAPTEMDLLEESIRSDGITMAIVVMRDDDGWTVIDGFHRRSVAVDRLGRELLPCVELSRERTDRMASTVRHNRARGKHDVELLAAIVREVLASGWDEDRAADALGTSPEELLRLRQIVGAAKALAAPEYNRAWGGRDGEHHSDK